MLPLLFLLPPIYGIKVLELLPGFFAFAVRFPSALGGRYALSISSLPLSGGWGVVSCCSHSWLPAPVTGSAATGNGNSPTEHCLGPPVNNTGATHSGPVPRLLAVHQKPWYRTVRVYSSLDQLRFSEWSCTGVGLPCAGLFAAWSGPALDNNNRFR